MPLMSGSRRNTSEDPDEASDEEMQEELQGAPGSDRDDEDADGDDDDDDEEAGGDDGGPPEEFIVEQILNHKWEEGVLKYLVKWQGYPKKSDQTWEPENTLDEVAALDEYLKGIGGRPEKGSKRGRKSAGASATPVPKKNRVKAEVQSKDEWDPPAGSWEDEITMIETLEKSETDLVCYVVWVNGRKSQHPAHVIYQKCPQKMLKFYESHLVFKDSS